MHLCHLIESRDESRDESLDESHDSSRDESHDESLDEMLWKDGPASLKSFRQEGEKRKRMCNLKGALAGS